MVSMLKSITGALLLGLSAQASFAQDVSKSDLNITGHGKTALIPNEQMKGWYDGPYHFSPAVRAGDFIFVSGTIGGAFESDVPIGKDEFKRSIRQAFKMLEASLAAGGASMKQVVKIRTFHVFDSEWIKIPKTEQILAVGEVKDEFIGEPHPAWTAVGTTALFLDKGLVEIEVVAYAPVAKE